MPGTRYCTTCGMALGTPGRVAASGSGGPAAPGGPTRPSLPLTAPLLAPGMLLDRRYEVVRALAQGGMSAVYEARDTRLSNRRYAVKVLLDAGRTPQDRQEAAGWFMREAQILSGLRHPLIPDIRDYFSEGGRHYLVMEFVDGQTLEEVLAARGGPGLPVREVLRWGRQLCEVLHYLHSQQPPLIFRDLKPDNIMLDRAGALKLIDFGIARSVLPGQTGHTIYTTIGTPGYSPPEQYQGLAEPRSDVYALGATLHHLLSGRDPRQYPPCTYPPLGALVKDIDPRVEAVVTRTLKFRVADRFDSVQALGRALAAAGAPGGVAAAARTSSLPGLGGAGRTGTAAPSYTGQAPFALVFRGRSYVVTTWKDVLMTVLDAVRGEHPHDFQRCLLVRGRNNKAYFSADPGALARPARVRGTTLYVDVPSGANATVRLCGLVLDAFGYQRADLHINAR
jgi:serine/threonine-protein kinase